MKKTRILSLLLCLSLFSTLIVPGTRAYAESDPDNGMKISKTATANGDGSYTVTLEAFATGAKTTTVQKKDIPTDIILVLDQSGSMEEEIGQVKYTEYTGNDTQNKSNYAKRHNGGSANLWHKLPDGSFVSVSVTLQQTITYTKITKGRNDSSKDGYTNYWNNRNNLYTYVNGEIKKVVYTRDRDNRFQNWNCKYALEDGTILNQNNESSRYSPTFQNTDDGYLYLAVVNENQNVYTYTYTDSSGTTQTLGTSTGANSSFTPAFYKRSTIDGGGSRIAALQSAARTFVNAVAEKAAGADRDINTTADNIDHRIAVVGYACGEWYNYTNYNYKNTEVFIGSKQYKYGTAARGQYSNAFQRMTTSSGVSNVNASINALDTDGGTLTNLGLEMANGIFANNPIENGETRNRVVILFTDGVPGWSGYESNVANSAITQANTAKNTYGATVYSIGIFAGADATFPGNQDGSETAKANWFMQQVSSNNGTPKYPSYYLSAGDAASLNSIFQQISNNITTGGSETTLGSETVVKDIISPYFTLPAGTTVNDIQIDTYACTAKNGDTYTWSSTSGGNGGASATVNGDQVSVTGFNFSENWCGTETDAQGSTTVRGKKLVISFVVSPKSGFLGGNDAITNASAGIYENDSAQTPVMTFEQPTVNVPIKDVTVTATDKNVYLKGEVTADQLKNGTEISVGDVPLDLTKDNYGLEGWQTEHVDITVEITDADGKVIPENDLKDLTDDKTYNVKVTVSPKTEGTESSGTPAVARNGKDEGTINVFKPELTYKDSTAYYGQTVPTVNGFSDNMVSEVWKHNTTVDSSVTMTGQKPTLNITYAPDNTKVHDGKYTKQDVPVSATVMIGTENVNEHTTFVHDTCSETGCNWKTPTEKGTPAFLIHIKTCTLNITKSGGDDNESYVFDVIKDGEKYSEVTIEGNGTETLVELPIGTYTISENAGWSWRYTADNGSSAVLTAQNPTGSITCTNTKTKDTWLNGFSAVVRNIFGQNH